MEEVGIDTRLLSLKQKQNPEADLKKIDQKIE